MFAGPAGEFFLLEDVVGAACAQHHVAQLVGGLVSCFSEAGPVGGGAGIAGRGLARSTAAETAVAGSVAVAGTVAQAGAAVAGSAAVGTAVAGIVAAVEGELDIAVGVFGDGDLAAVDHAENQRGGEVVGAGLHAELAEGVGRGFKVAAEGDVAAPCHLGRLDSQYLLAVHVARVAADADDGGQREHEEYQELGESLVVAGGGRRAEVGPFHRRGQGVAEIAPLHARAREHALLETQQHYHRAVAHEGFGALVDHRPVAEIHPAVEAEAPGAGIGGVELMLQRAHRDPDVPGRRAQPGRNRLEMQHVVVVQRLDAAAHGVADVEHMVAAAAYAPAELHSVAPVEDAAAASLLREAAVGVPRTLVDVAAPALVADRQVAHLDVAEVAAHQIPFGAVGGAHVPALMDAGGAVGQQGQGDVDVAYLRSQGGRRQAERRGRKQDCGEGGKTFHTTIYIQTINEQQPGWSESENRLQNFTDGISVLPSGSLR